MIKLTSSGKSVFVSIILLLSIFTQAQITPDSNGIIYVKPAASGNGGGSSWNDATDDLHNAIHATGVQKVFVAVGTYPVGDNSFVMKNGVQIYGGFDPGNGITTLAHNRILPNKGMSDGSVLDGENVRPVIWNDNNGLNNTAVIDGFTLMRGKGGGIYNNIASPVFNNLVIRDNYKDANADGGAGMNNYACSPVMTNVIFQNNTAYLGVGGAIFNTSSTVTITNAIFKGNQAPSAAGTVIYNAVNSSATLTNVLITGHNAVLYLIAQAGGSITLNNVSIANNTGTTLSIGSGGTATINNSIIFGGISGSNTTQYSFIQGNTDTNNGNINTTGLGIANIFTNPSAGDYTLKSPSVINKGNNALYPTVLDVNTKDLAGNARLVGTNIDLGAYEYPYSIVPDANGTVYVKQTVAGDGSGSDWDNATSDLHNAIHTNGVTKVFVAIGNYNVGDNSFIMKNGVEIYGGFDPANNIKTLSDNRIMPDASNNALGSVLNGQSTRPVIWNFNNGLDATAVLDGFNIANGSYTNGGGIVNAGSSPTYRNLVIRGNNATVTGGGMYNFGSSPNIINTVFKNNAVVSTSGGTVSGGAIYNDNVSAPVLTNVNIIANVVSSSGTEKGAGIYNNNSNPKIYNSILWNNTKQHTGGGAPGSDIESSGGTVTLKNSITQSYTTGDNADNNLVNINPNFQDISSGNYKLQLSSPAIGMGNNTYYSGLDASAKDLAGNPRLSGDIIDIGVYEYQLNITPTDGIVYVKPTVSGTGDGSSWANATNFLQDAISSTAVQKVYVATGNYNVGNNSFIMKNGVEIYGGFNPAGNVTDWETRTLPNKGMGDGSVLNGKNERPVIWNVFTSETAMDNTAVLDGFTITNGKGSTGGGICNNYASPALRNLWIKGNTATSDGGGVYNVNSSSPVITDVILSGNMANYAGGIFNRNSSSPVITNIVIQTNTANNDGGGMYNDASASPVITNVSITENTAASGAGMYNRNASPVVTNVLIADNTAVTNGGAIRNESSSSPILTNVTIADNTGVSTIYSTGPGSTAFNNSIVFGTVSASYTAQYSLIEGNTDFSNGNIDMTGITATDIFTDYDNADYTLREFWVAVNAGNNALNTTETDLVGNARVYNNGVIDLGAYESSYNSLLTPDTNGIIYVKETGSGDRSGNSWANAASDLHNAIHTDGVSKVFVAVGNYNVEANSFIMKNDVEIYGGFDPDNSISTLDDDRILPTGLPAGGSASSEGSVLNGQNARPLIWNSDNGVTTSAVLDGFTLKNGYDYNHGSAIYNYMVSPTLRNLVLKNNQGTVLSNLYSSPIVTNCTIISNTGCGVENGSSSDNLNTPVFTNCIISGNIGFSGGGVYNSVTAAKFINCLITGNTATYHSGAGGVYNTNSTLTVAFINSTIAGNNGTYGYFNTGDGTFLQNSIIWEVVSGNYKASNSLIKDKTDTTNGNIDATGFAAEDVFTDPDNGDYTLKENSPAIDAGDEDLYGELDENTKDLAGNPRIYDFNGGGYIDLGVYESSYNAFPYIALTPDVNGIIYVRETAVGDENGSSWNNATANLKRAMRVTDVQQVWVATGTYPAYNAKMRNGVAIYGGFDPDNDIDDLSDSRILPDYDTNTEGSVINGGNAGSVISNNDNGLDNTAILNGFTLTNGKSSTGAGIYNNGASPILSNLWIKGNTATDDGGGIYNNNSSSPVMTNITLSGNSARYGGGMFNRNSSSPVMSNVIIKSNTTAEDGGGMYNDASASPVMTNVAITGNAAKNGAGMYNRTNSSPILVNTLIANNTATTNGGAIRNESTSSPVLTNVTIAGNGGSNAVYATDGTTTIDNSIVFGTISGSYAAQYSMIEDSSATDNGNIDMTDIISDDVFYNPANGDYSLKDTAVAINTGNNALFTGLDENTKDLAGNPRLFGGIIDLGAYESQATPSNCPDFTTWDGVSWSNGEPDFDKKAIIDGELTLSSDLNACELEVTENGNLQIPSGFTFTVNGLITNNAPAGNFVVASDGNLIQVEDVENLGAITVIRDSQPMIRLDYTMWSSPVIGQNLFGFSPETVNGVTNYPGSAGRIYVYDGTNGYVNPSPFNENSVMNSGVGYLFRSPNNFDTTVPTVYNGTFTGVPFNSGLNVTTVANDYTSIGNPYPSNIDADDFISSNPEVSTLYFWNNNHSAGNSYATCTYGNCVAAAGGGNTPNGFISTGQGFIVATTGTSVNFDNSMRTENNATFIKTYDTERHRFWLNLNGENEERYNQMLVSYMDGATNGIDNQIDGKLFGYEGSAIYSLIDDASTGSATKLTIQGRGLPFEDSDIVPLGFRASESGKFKISLDHFDGLFTEGNVTIYLKDKQMHIIHNLMESDYEFESGQGEFNERFEIVYGEEGTMGTDDQNANQIRIYTDMDYIVVDSKTEKILSVELYDLNGRNIQRDHTVNANIYKVKSVAKGIIVVKAQTETGEIVTKKVVNK